MTALNTYCLHIVAYVSIKVTIWYLKLWINCRFKEK